MRKVCLTISKKGKARFISHLDLYRAIERSLRRALLPIVFTEGYNPHPKISFLSALELGATSDCEKALLYLTEPIPPSELKERLNRFLPEDIRVEDVHFVNSGKIMADSSLFLIKIKTPPTKSREELEQALTELKKTPSFVIKRESKGKVKEINIKEFIKELKVEEFSPGETILQALILITPHGSVKPIEVVEALESFLPEIKMVSVHRKQLFLREVEK